jgi:hydrogenase nickel incorporation protein HypA/HybF
MARNYAASVHEMSIAHDLVSLIESQVNHVRVVAVRVRVGELSGVVPEALRAAFGPASAGTCADGARLDLEPVPISVWCDACNAEQHLPGPGRLCCPRCGGRTPRVLAGRELELHSLEIIDGASDRSGSPADPQEQRRAGAGDAPSVR